MTLPAAASTPTPATSFKITQLGYKRAAARGWTLTAGFFSVLIIAIAGYMSWYVYTPSLCPEPCYGQIAILPVWFFAIIILVPLLVLGVIQGVRWYEFSYQLRRLAMVPESFDTVSVAAPDQRDEPIA